MTDIKANCKLQVYNTVDALTHTITTDVIECHTKDVLTSGVGTFSFTLPAIKDGFDNAYDDIGNNFKVKASFGYDDNYTHVFTGKILSFTTVVAEQALRTFTGKSLSEILERRFKYNTRWIAEEADDIAAEVASDLSLSSSLATDTSAETVTVRTESYFDLLKKVSDYWVNAGTQVQKDFYVDKDNALQWKARPIRTVGVETFTYQDDFFNYNLKYDILPIKNYVTVYGAARAPLPLDQDEWTDSLTDWTAVSGTLALDATTPKAGTYWVVCQSAAPKICDFYRVIPRVTVRDINKLRFWHSLSNEPADTAYVKLWAPDSSNTFWTVDGTLAKTNAMHWNDLPLGDANEYDADENPSGIWNKTGSPNWFDIQGVKFYFHGNGGGVGDIDAYVDKMSFYPERWMATAEDATSQTSYGLREAEYTDENLLSEAECEVRAETLLYQLKDRLLRLDFAVAGNTNVLLGDRLTLSLPLDNVSAQAFDVVSVEHHFSAAPNGYQTIVNCLQGVTSRALPAVSPLDSVRNQLGHVREITSEIYRRIVR